MAKVKLNLDAVPLLDEAVSADNTAVPTTTNELEEYAQQHRSTRFEHHPKWHERVVATGFGASGNIESYLKNWGRGIGPVKLRNLAMQAEENGFGLFAEKMWRKAFEVENGHVPEGDLAAISGSAGTTVQATSAANEEFDEFPSDLQPGRTSPMQPTDTERTVEELIADDTYVATPKRDGHKRLIFVTAERVAYQTRSGRDQILTITAEIDQALIAAAQQSGAYVVEGEEYHLDVEGNECLTAADAAEANARLHKQPGAPVRTRLAIIKVLFAEGKDYRRSDAVDRYALAQAYAPAWQMASDAIEVVPVAETADEKQSLWDTQVAEHREGVVFENRRAFYVGGKNEKGKTLVRKKQRYPMDVVILNLTPSEKPGREFGAIEVGAWDNDSQSFVSLGNVGTGFSHAKTKEIAAAHRAAPGQVVISISCLRLTPRGQLREASFDRLRPDKMPTECTERQPFGW